MGHQIFETFEIYSKFTTVASRTRCAKGETPTNIYKVTVPKLKHQPKRKNYKRTPIQGMGCFHQSW